MTRHPVSRRHALAMDAAATVAPLAARAQAGYPDKPVTIVVGYSAGGAVDAVARTLGQALSKAMGQTFVIENKPGAGTNIAVKTVIDARPDGYTLLMAANALAANMALFKPAPFDAEKDLVPVALVGRVPVVIAANANAPYANIKQLIAAAKGRPNTIAFASPGNGSTPHMAAELFARAAGIDLQHVPYRGGAQAITDVIGGQVPLLAMNALEVKPHVAAGKLKVLAVLSPQRSPIFPDVPTIAESGFKGFEASVWYALMAPANTPAAVVDKLHAEVQKALATPEVKERMTAVGGQVIPGTRQMLASLLHSERARYDNLVREAHITPD
jgi:tripartite-type tricarboxylate transporter receptor subunit TctC